MPMFKTTCLISVVFLIGCKQYNVVGYEQVVQNDTIKYEFVKIKNLPQLSNSEICRQVKTKKVAYLDLINISMSRYSVTINDSFVQLGDSVEENTIRLTNVDVGDIIKIKSDSNTIVQFEAIKGYPIISIRKSRTSKWLVDFCDFVCDDF